MRLPQKGTTAMPTTVTHSRTNSTEMTSIAGGGHCSTSRLSLQTTPRKQLNAEPNSSARPMYKAKKPNATVRRAVQNRVPARVDGHRSGNV